MKDHSAYLRTVAATFRSRGTPGDIALDAAADEMDTLHNILEALEAKRTQLLDGIAVLSDKLHCGCYLEDHAPAGVVQWSLWDRDKHCLLGGDTLIGIIEDLGEDAE